jgi:hypothetical protein
MDVQVYFTSEISPVHEAPCQVHHQIQLGIFRTSAFHVGISSVCTCTMLCFLFCLFCCNLHSIFSSICVFYNNNLIHHILSYTCLVLFYCPNILSNYSSNSKATIDHHGSQTFLPFFTIKMKLYRIKVNNTDSSSAARRALCIDQCG